MQCVFHCISGADLHLQYFVMYFLSLVVCSNDRIF